MKRMLMAAVAVVLAACASSGTAPRPVSSAVARADGPPPLILISIDGFRADYIGRGRAPVLARLAKGGVTTSAMRPAFPSLTFPNHYTLVTGVRPDRHGIVANTMEDAAIPGVRFALSNFDAVSYGRWWNGARPLWVTAKAQGLRTATLFWPGSEAAIAGPGPGAKAMRPDLWAHFDEALPPARRVDMVLDWLDLPPDKRPQFLTLYFDQVDHAGHDFGPDAPQVDEAVAEIDAAIGRLAAGLAQRGVQADLVIVSDHGMAAASPDRELFLDDWIDVDQADVITSGPLMGVRLKDEARAAALLARHAHARCWRKGEVPPALHYGRHPRVPPYVCLADPGWIISTRASAARRRRFSLGQHGYDPTAPEMASLFIANGPAFRAGVRLAPFENVDVYPMLARVLGVRPDPNEGDPATWSAALR